MSISIERNPDAADRFVDAVQETCDIIADRSFGCSTARGTLGRSSSADTTQARRHGRRARGSRWIPGWSTAASCAGREVGLGGGSPRSRASSTQEIVEMRRERRRDEQQDPQRIRPRERAAKRREQQPPRAAVGRAGVRAAGAGDRATDGVQALDASEPWLLRRAWTDAATFRLMRVPPGRAA